jgi:hypothetical protein
MVCRTDRKGAKRAFRLIGEWKGYMLRLTIYHLLIIVSQFLPTLKYNPDFSSTTRLNYTNPQAFLKHLIMQRGSWRDHGDQH